MKNTFTILRRRFELRIRDGKISSKLENRACHSLPMPTSRPLHFAQLRHICEHCLTFAHVGIVCSTKWSTSSFARRSSYAEDQLRELCARPRIMRIANLRRNVIRHAAHRAHTSQIPHLFHSARGATTAAGPASSCIRQTGGDVRPPLFAIALEPARSRRAPRRPPPQSPPRRRPPRAWPSPVCGWASTLAWDCARLPGRPSGVSSWRRARLSESPADAREVERDICHVV